MKLDLEVKTEVVEVHIPMTFERRGGRKIVITPDVVEKTDKTPKRDETLVRAIVKSHCWRRRIECGQAKSITDLAGQEGVSDAYVCQMLPLTTLSPEIVAAIIDGRQSNLVKLQSLKRNTPSDWKRQRELWDGVIPKE